MGRRSGSSVMLKGACLPPRSGALTPQDKARNGPGQPGHCGYLLGRAWGLQCPGGRSVLERKQTRQSGPRQAHSPVLRAVPS